MIFSKPTESTNYNPYILDFPLWNDAVWSIYLSKDSMEAILNDILVLKDGESFYIKRNWD